MSAEHKPPLAAFVVLALMAVLLVGYQIRAQAIPGLARVVNPVVVAAGTLVLDGAGTVPTDEPLRPRASVVRPRIVAAAGPIERTERPARTGRAGRQAATDGAGARPESGRRTHVRPAAPADGRQDSRSNAGDRQGPPAHAAVHRRLPAHAPAHGVRAAVRGHAFSPGKSANQSRPKARGACQRDDRHGADRSRGKGAKKGHGKARKGGRHHARRR